MLSGWPRPLVFGHRGACALAPENTLASFWLAVELGADAIEFDVKLSADDHVVVMHDPTVNRTTNGKGRVSGLSLAELKELDAGGKFSTEFTGENIPTLRQVFEQLGDKIRMNIELTNQTTPFDKLTVRVIELIREYQYEDRILLSSFVARNLRIAKKLLPDVPRGLLASPRWLGIIARRYGWKQGHQALHPNLRDVDQRLVDEVHAAGKRVHVYTVNGKENLRKMIELGVDGIFTDDPGLMRRLLDGKE